MKTWFIRGYGGPEMLELGEFEEPVVGPYDVLVGIRAASVNPIDKRVREGELKALVKYQFPLAMGTDLSGVVLQCGCNVTRFSIGDEIFSRPNRLRIGSFSERISIHESEVSHKPKSLTFEEAASLPLVGLTSFQALTEIANVKPGCKVLIQAGAGGVGTFAIQLAKHLGAYVATTASKPKHELLYSLGADEVIDYRDNDFEKVLKGYDVVFDTLGGVSLLKAFNILRPGGIVVSVSGPPDIHITKDWKLPLYIRLVIRLKSRKVRKIARSRN